jgi:hypothetical protein
MTKTIGYEKAGQMLDSMSNFEIARWQAMMDAVELINETCQERKKDFNAVDIKPKAIEKYIESTCDIYCRNIERQREQEAVIKYNQELDILPKLVSELNSIEV